MKKYYDKRKERLVFIGETSNREYWDDHWDDENFKQILVNSENHFVVNKTKKYLEKGASILEGGCGRGDKVYALKEKGYRAVGVDYAASTVRKINSLVPELDVTEGDVRALPFEDNSFQGYWSLGVIEHFFCGYEDIALEMSRVISPGGYLFLTVPSMSLLRKVKGGLSMYPDFNESLDANENFYQFALPPKSVITHFENIGFKLLEKEPIDGIKGLKDEVRILNPVLQWCYDKNNILAKVIRKTINVLFKGFSNHMTFFVFKKV